MNYYTLATSYLARTVGDLNRLNITLTRLFREKNTPEFAMNGTDYEGEIRNALGELQDKDAEYKALTRYVDAVFAKDQVLFEIDQAPSERELAPLLDRFSEANFELVRSKTDVIAIINQDRARMAALLNQNRI